MLTAYAAGKLFVITEAACCSLSRYWVLFTNARSSAFTAAPAYRQRKRVQHCSADGWCARRFSTKHLSAESVAAVL